ncbi:MAG: hypothetical protein ACM31L_17780 [Actinomycetota bacterium]
MSQGRDGDDIQVVLARAAAERRRHMALALADRLASILLEEAELAAPEAAELLDSPPLLDAIAADPAAMAHITGNGLGAGPGGTWAWLADGATQDPRALLVRIIAGDRTLVAPCPKK